MAATGNGCLRLRGEEERVNIGFWGRGEGVEIKVRGGGEEELRR